MGVAAIPVLRTRLAWASGYRSAENLQDRCSELCAAASARFEVTTKEIRGSRTHRASTARHWVWTGLRGFGFTYESIAGEFGYHWTTVMKATKRWARDKAVLTGETK